MRLEGLIPLWDMQWIDKEKTDALLSANRPERAGSVLVCDAPWDGNCDFFNIVHDEGLLRMYCCNNRNNTLYCNYYESDDGIHWRRPILNIVEVDGSTKNNILGAFEGPVFVMKDENPACLPEQRYKAIWGVHFREIRCAFSSDGIHFGSQRTLIRAEDYEERITNLGDSLNTLVWRQELGKYQCFLRTTDRRRFSPGNPNLDIHDEGRAIRVMESDDFIHWTVPREIVFTSAHDYELYCGCVSQYIHDKRYLIGFPVRYVERSRWTDNFEQLCGREYRDLRRGAVENGVPTDRHATAITDCVFMSSLDGQHWHRFDEACITPGPEQPHKWVYGDCYCAVGQLDTPGRFEYEPNEVSILCEMYHWNTRPTELMRFVYRKDGFASFKADYAFRTLQTKPFVLEANTLSLNFRTSVRGCVFVNVLDEAGYPIPGFSSCELFGDTLERFVNFKQNLGKLRGQRLRLQLYLRDGEIYSLTFHE